MKYFTRNLLDLVFPRSDVWTGSLIEESNLGQMYLNASTLGLLDIITGPVCSVCGISVGDNALSTGCCEKCYKIKNQPISNRSVLKLNNVGRAIIHELKYREGLHLLNDIESIISKSEVVSASIKGTLLVPVPLHKRKLKERGYNQSLLLAHAFNNVLGDNESCVVELITRNRDTDSQTLMDRDARIKNVKKAFRLRSGYEELRKKDKPITIIDDVYTTGSTIQACASTLRKHGFRRIRSVTLGHG